MINQLQEDSSPNSDIDVYFYISCSPPQTNLQDSATPSLKQTIPSFQGTLVRVLLQVWGIEHPLISRFPKIKVTLLHKRLTAGLLCTESHPLTFYQHFSPRSEERQALILHKVPESKAPFICPTNVVGWHFEEVYMT